MSALALLQKEGYMGHRPHLLGCGGLGRLFWSLCTEVLKGYNPKIPLPYPDANPIHSVSSAQDKYLRKILSPIILNSSTLEQSVSLTLYRRESLFSMNLLRLFSAQLIDFGNESVEEEDSQSVTSVPR